MRLRSLSEITTNGHLIWFDPALARLEGLRDFFSHESPVYIGRAPGRLDVMGGIGDYSGAQVLELPLDRCTWAMVQRQSAPRCEIISSRSGVVHHFAIDLATLDAGDLGSAPALHRWFADRSADQWAAYLTGIVQLLLHVLPDSVRRNPPGLRIVVESTVPEGKGVSSSAALEVATMAAVGAAYGIALTPTALASMCQWVENHVVGAPCGIMDQMTSALGRRNALLRLRCQPDTVEGHLAVPPGFRFYGIDSGVRHAVTGSDYRTVRTAAFMGYRMIAAEAHLPVTRENGRVRIEDDRWHGYLANLPTTEFAERFEEVLPVSMRGSDFLTQYGGTTDNATSVEPQRDYPIRQATAHPIREQERVTRFTELLPRLGTDAGAAGELGRLMYGSHESYGACGLGSDATDRLVAKVTAAGPERGLHGARITGGGSGGTVAVLGTVDAEPLVREIAARYTADTGRLAEVFADSGPGAAETGVLELSLRG